MPVGPLPARSPFPVATLIPYSLPSSEPKETRAGAEGDATGAHEDAPPAAAPPSSPPAAAPPSSPPVAAPPSSPPAATASTLSPSPPTPRTAARSEVRKPPLRYPGQSWCARAWRGRRSIEAPRLRSGASASCLIAFLRSGAKFFHLAPLQTTIMRQRHEQNCQDLSMSLT
jgi:hypothetical protein